MRTYFQLFSTLLLFCCLFYACGLKSKARIQQVCRKDWEHQLGNIQVTSMSASAISIRDSIEIFLEKNLKNTSLLSEYYDLDSLETKRVDFLVEHFLLKVIIRKDTTK